jgi:mono/diheme cytochrome c family protein
VSRPRQATLLLVTAVAAIAFAAGCGGGNEPIANNRGAQLFRERCSGCHTLEAAGAEGTISGKQLNTRPTGPNLNKRPETPDSVLYAIRNGGFSGAIMPQNVVVGDDAQAVAEFVAKYAGTEAKSPPSPKGPAGATGGQSNAGSGG